MKPQESHPESQICDLQTEQHRSFFFPPKVSSQVILSRLSYNKKKIPYEKTKIGKYIKCYEGKQSCEDSKEMSSNQDLRQEKNSLSP